MKKILALLLTGVLMISLLSGCGSEEKTETGTDTVENSEPTTFPSKNLSGIVQWGAGGGTDSLMRPLASLAEEQLGVSIVVENKTGGTGSIATQYVYDSDADGYTLLMGAENPQLYGVLGISELTYANFEPVFIIGDETVGVVVGKDSPYASLTDLVNAALENPDSITLASTGTGGLPWEVASYLTAVTGATFKQIPYDSDASARTAVIGGECDFTIAKIQSGLESHIAGDLTFISMLAKEPIASLEDVSLIIDEYPDFEQFLPWGPFYGIFVKKGTEPELIQTLADGFSAAYQDSSYQELLGSFNINALGLTGDDAKTYLSSWQYNTVSALYNSGAIEQSPEELGIEQ